MTKLAAKTLRCKLALLVAGVCVVGGRADEEGMGLAAQFPGDKGIGKHPDVIFATDFEAGIGAPLKIERKGVSLLNDPTIALSGKSCARITATKDVDEGGDISFHWQEGVDTCYLRVYVRFDRETLMPHHFINITAMGDQHKYRWGGGAGLLPPGGVDGRVSTTLEPPKDDTGHWMLYSYWHQMRSWQSPEGKPAGRPSPYYGNNFRVEKSPPIVRDKWICLEIMLKLNQVGQYDGEQACWIDGQKIGHWKKGSPVGTWIRDSFATFGVFNTKPQPFEGFNWRTSDKLTINRIKLQWYLSRDKSWSQMKIDQNTVYFDNLVVAKSYIGPLKQPEP